MREPRRGFEDVGFSFVDGWLEHPDRYALQPGLVLTQGHHAPPAGRAVFGYGAQADEDRRELFRRLVFNVLVSNVDDHLRNHGFLWDGREGWRLSPAFDLNPTPVDVRGRRLTTSIDLEDGTCDLGLVLEVAPFFALGDRVARSLIRSVADGVIDWRAVATELGAGRSEIERMSSAFDHDDARAAARL